MTRIGRERGWPPTTRQHFEEIRGPAGSLLVGSPQQVIDKIIFEHSIFNNDRFLAQMDVGTLPHDKLMKSIELFGTKVAPEVKEALKNAPAVK
jgi:alkanesulfonate monooxygenase SsuD/methylene tetrahydromethanopterin reductase-like flavin-dependent oxidoreductase (luciferase family)